MIRAENKKIIMTEGDFGLALPITIIGQNIDVGETIKFSLKKTNKENVIEDKNYNNIVENKIELIFTKEESEKLKSGKYFYYIDWYRGDTFLGNIINGEIFEVEEK